MSRYRRQQQKRQQQKRLPAQKKQQQQGDLKVPKEEQRVGAEKRGAEDKSGVVEPEPPPQEQAHLALQQQPSPLPLPGQPIVMVVTPEQVEEMIQQLIKDNPDLVKTLQSAKVSAPKRRWRGFLRWLGITADVLTIIGSVINSVAGYQPPQAKTDSSEIMTVLLTNEESRQQWGLMERWINEPTQREKELTFEINNNQLIVSNAKLFNDQSVKAVPIATSTFSGEQFSIEIDEIKTTPIDDIGFQLTWGPGAQSTGYFTATFDIHHIPYELSIYLGSLEPPNRNQAFLV